MGSLARLVSSPGAVTPDSRSRRQRVVRLCVRTRPEQAAGTTERQMTQYLISFGARAMDHIPDEDAPAVARAARGGPGSHQRRRVRVPRRGGKPAGEHRGHRRGGTDGPHPEAIGGFTLVEEPLREEALRWRPKIAVACRCALEVRAIGPIPNSTRCSARPIAGGDVPAVPDRRRLAALEQDLPWPAVWPRGPAYRPEPETRGSASWPDATPTPRTVLTLTRSSDSPTSVSTGGHADHRVHAWAQGCRGSCSTICWMEMGTQLSSAVGMGAGTGDSAVK